MTVYKKIQKIKCLVIGDGCVGKACLAVTYTTNEFPEGYNATILEIFKKQMRISRKEAANLEITVVAGQEDYDRLRAIAYTGTDVILLCFSLVSPDSYENIKNKWIDEINKYCPDAPVILVGTKLDQRNATVDQHNKNDKRKTLHQLITFSEGYKLMEEIGAIKYIECSALTRDGLNEIFDEAVRIVRVKTAMRKPHNSCTLS